MARVMRQPLPAVPAVDGSAWILSAIISVAITALFVGFSQDHWHHYVLPVMLGGIVIGRDTIDWLRGRVDVLDPVGMLGVYGLYYFLMTPLLHVLWDFWWGYRFNPLDWRPWLGYMAWLNLLGLLLYRATRIAMLRNNRPLKTEWRLHPQRFWIVVGTLMTISAAMQAYVYIAYGGVSGFVYAYVDNIGGGTTNNPFLGRGWQFTISESFPMLSAFAFIVIASRRPALRSYRAIALFLLFQIGLELIFGGLRGNRNNVVFGLFWTVGLIHLQLKRLTRKQVLVGIVTMFMFMNIYYFYKHGGLEGIQSITDTTARDTIVSRKRQGTDEQKFILLHDFGRADIQALALYLITTGDEYKLAYGRTYLGGAASLVPRSLWPDRPPAVHKERTELLHGARSPYRQIDYVVPWIFGAPGEALLNFGAIGVPFVFVVWGLAVGWLVRLFRRLPHHDARRLMLPLLVGLSLILFIGDSHIVAFFLMKDGLMPFLAVFLGSDRVPVES